MTPPRRAFVRILIAALFAAPLALAAADADAQQARIYRVGVFILGGTYYQAIDGLRDGLRELGLKEGTHFVLHIRDTKGDIKSVEAAARSLEGEKVDLIYSVATSVTLVAKRATKKSVPIVFYAGGDPVASGFVESFSKGASHWYPWPVLGSHPEASSAPEGDASWPPPSGDVLQP
jgi:ABC-type uncharacterized transport system substrate-binding protein